MVHPISIQWDIPICKIFEFGNSSSVSKCQANKQSVQNALDWFGLDVASNEIQYKTSIINFFDG